MNFSFSNHILEIHDVSKFFGRKGYIVTALEDVSLTVNLSENIAIVGETGSGKSTLGRISCGLEKPSKGKVLLSGKEIGSYRKNELWKIEKGNESEYGEKSQYYKTNFEIIIMEKK